jgi:hypothetical protein
MLIIPWWIWHSFGRIEFFPFSCWPVFLDEHTKLSHRLRGSFFLAYLIVRVLRFLCFRARPLSRSLRMSTLAVTFPRRFFSPGSEIDLAFPYLPLPHCRRFSTSHFECFLGMHFLCDGTFGFCFYVPSPLSVDRSPGHRWVLMNIYL